MICLGSKKRVRLAWADICLSLVCACIILVIIGNVNILGGKRVIVYPNEFSGVHDIEWRDDKASFSTLSDDSYMWVDFDTPIDIKRLVVNFRNCLNNDWVLQVYYDIDNTGMKEENSVIKRVYANDDRVVLNINANGITAIRIDWGGEAGNTFKLENVETNIFDPKTDIMLFVLVFVIFFSTSSINLWFDLESGYRSQQALLRTTLKSAFTIILFFIVHISKDLRINDGYNIAFGLMILSMSIINVIDHWILVLIKRKVRNVAASERFEAFCEKTEIAIILAIFFLLAFYDTQSSFIVEICNNLLPVILTIGLFLFSVEYRKIKNRIVAVFLLIMQTAMIIDFFVHGEGMIYHACAFFLFVALAHGINEMKIVKSFLWISVFSFLVTYILSVTGVYEYYVGISVGGETMKRTMGYSHPNVASIHVFTITLLIIYIINNLSKKRLLLSLVVAILSILLIYQVGGRTSIIGLFYVLFVIIGFGLCSFFPYINKIWLEKNSIITLAFAQSVFILCFIGSILFSWFYNKTQDNFLMRTIGLVYDNRTFGERLDKANYVLHNYKPHLFGQVIPAVIDGKDSFVENYYVNSMFNDGLILLICFCVLTIIMNVQLCKKKQYYRAFLLTAIPIVAVSECIAINPINNAFTFLALSKLETWNEAELLEKKHGIKRLVVFFLLALALYSIFPIVIAYLKTFFEIYNLTDKACVFIVVIVVILIGFTIKLTYSAIIKSFDNKIFSDNNKNSLITLACMIAIVTILMITTIIGVNKKNAVYIEQELSILELIADNTQGKIYADRLPVLYKNKVRGIDYSYLYSDDLCFKRNVTLITDAEDDKPSFFNKGFLYMQISDASAIYTNNPEVETLLNENGYNLHGYNNHIYKVDLGYEAELNNLKLTGDGRICLYGDNKLLDKGPYITLSTGKYTVSYLLHVVEIPLDNDIELCQLTVSNQWGQNTIAQRSITADMADENGDITCQIPINGSGAGYEFKIDLLSDIAMDVKSIEYAKTPDYDTRIKVDDEWRKIREEYYDLEGNPIALENGYSIVEYEYDEAGNRTVNRYYDADNKPVLYKGQYWYNEVTFNDLKQNILEKFYGTDGNPILLQDGAAGYRREYDENGNVSATTYLGLDGNPTTNTSGYTTWHRIYNDKKQIVREEYYDGNGQSILLPGGQAAVEYEYDELGNRIVNRYYDADNEPVLYNGQYWYNVLSYNDKKQNVLEKLYGTDGNPILLRDGAAGYRREYDENGNVSATTYLGLDGNPTTNTSGYTTWHRIYNDKKQIVREEYYDGNGQSILLSGGQAAVEYEYDEAGNRTVNRYYDANYEPVLYNGQYWYNEAIYNDLRQNILERFYGIEGNPILLPDGAAGYRRKYDENGNISATTYLGEDGNPTINISGFSTWHRFYNEKKQIVREEYYDVKNEAVTLLAGQGAVEYEYDDVGNRTVDRYYDVSGNPILYAGEYWYLVRTFNDKKQCVHEDYYGLDDKRILRSAGYCSVDIKYDEGGTIVGKTYFGLDGEVVAEE